MTNITSILPPHVVFLLRPTQPQFFVICHFTKEKYPQKMQPGFLLKKQEGEDEDVHEERRFRAHMEEALKKSLMDEVDDSFNPPAERGTRRRVD